MKGYTNAHGAVTPMEKVLVNVTSDNGVLPNGFIITITDNKGTVLGTTGESSYSISIPYDTEYIVSASSVDGYITPASQTFTASQPARNVDVVYKVILFGVFIYDIDGNLTLPELWNTANNSKAVGVAIVADNCRFVVAKEDAKSSYVHWVGYDTDISTLTNYTDAALAATDFDGVNNTSKIIAAIGSSNAAGDCSAYTFPNGKTGYLGAAGEWQVARQNKEDLNSALTLIGGTTMKESYYWTSTEYSSSSAWIQFFGSSSNLSSHLKDDFSFVRAFTPYIANPNIISFTIEGMTYQCWEGTTWGQWCSSAFNNFGCAVRTDNRIGNPNYPNKSRIYDKSTDEFVYNTDIIKDGGKYWDYMSEPF